MGVNHQIRDRTIAHQASMAQWTRTEADALIRVLRDAQRRLTDRIAGYDPDSFTRRRMEQMLSAVDAMHHEYLQEFRDEVRRLGRDAIRAETQFERMLMQSTVPLEIDFTTPSARSVYAAATERPMSGKMLNDWLRDIEASTRDQIERAIRSGFVEGRTPEQIAREIRGHRRENYRDGIMERGVNRRLSALVRTSINHYATAARETVYEENESLIKGVQIVATLDARTSTICMNYDGQVFPIGEGPRPPFHPNCRSTTIPVVKSWRDLGIDLEEAPPGTRASMDGQVPDTERFPKWLERQSATRQRAVLGESRYRAWRAGEVALSDLTVGSRQLSLDELGIEDVRTAQGAA